MNAFKIISLTHKLASRVNRKFLDENHQQDYLGGFKNQNGFKRINVLSTCNRVGIYCKHRP